ncbi:hypothetical protein J7T55_010250 [Diaporthe amygdali]|uniref:uncharacterized protein n=1 Tax=Phomopsis amygdali TaxID=1214568 RepID=UPI0022FE82F4|nr:uncharacterized protein J7T55_010250 [Diaporthe amygdali]KAJ0114006.1 hypothetical protein J7T55_010250 [Diaporthe amygdali]
MPSPKRPKASVDYLDSHISSEDESTRRRSAHPRGFSPKLERGISETSLMRRESKAEGSDNHDKIERAIRDMAALNLAHLRKADTHIPALTAALTDIIILPDTLTRTHNHTRTRTRTLIPTPETKIKTTTPTNIIRGLSHNSRQTKPKPKTNKMPWEDFPWEDAAKVAFQAGGVALMKVGTEQMPWQIKGTKVASAALGAAVVDHVLKPKKRGGVKYAAMRHLAEVAVGNMVVSPALGKMSGGGGRKRISGATGSTNTDFIRTGVDRITIDTVGLDQISIVLFEWLRWSRANASFQATTARSPPSAQAKRDRVSSIMNPKLKPHFSEVATN